MMDNVVMEPLLVEEYVMFLVIVLAEDKERSGEVYFMVLLEKL